MKKLKKSFLYLILITFILPLTAISEMYKWIDENGVTHYSNTAPPESIKNVQEKEEEKFDEEKHQRLMEQKKEFEAQRAAEIEVKEALEAEKNKIAKQRRKQQEKEKLANEKEKLANKYFKKMNSVADEKFGSRIAEVLGGIGTSLMNCPGANLKTALKYYEQAESTLKNISKCKKSSPHGVRYYSRPCTDNLFENAMSQKKTGDSYMGCSQEYMRTIEMEERVKRAERMAERARRKARQAYINSLNN